VLNQTNTDREYYFSLDNLCKDMYLRKHMDSQGFVTLTIIADFNRIKALCQDLELLKFVCQQSHNIEYRLGADGQDRLRKREGWEKWVLEMAQRDPSAQNDGPGEMKFPPPPLPPGDQQSVSVPHRQASLPLQTSPLLAPPINGVSHAQQDVRGEPHEFNTYSRYQGSPPGTTKALHSKHNSESVNATNGVSEKEKDAFSDAQVEKLSVMVRPAGAGSSNVNDRYSNRTLSNGSIASGSLEGLESLNGIAAGSGPNGAASSHE
jgi:la-related protein 1